MQRTCDLQDLCNSSRYGSDQLLTNKLLGRLACNFVTTLCTPCDSHTAADCKQQQQTLGQTLSGTLSIPQSYNSSKARVCKLPDEKEMQIGHLLANVRIPSGPSGPPTLTTMECHSTSLILTSTEWPTCGFKHASKSSYSILLRMFGLCSNDDPTSSQTRSDKLYGGTDWL